MSIPHLVRPDRLSFFLDGDTLSVATSDDRYSAILTCLALDDADTIRDLLKPIAKIEAAVQVDGSAFTSDGSNIFFNGDPVSPAIAKRMLWMLENNMDIQPLREFYIRLQNNPSYRAVQELFGFLDACDLPITSDGFFLAYKRVRNDFKDIHSNTMDNSPGQVLRVARNRVDEDANRTCSYGLHVCSQSYLPNFSSNDPYNDRVVVCKIDPADVVAVPTDYNNAKMRVCGYTVLEEVQQKKPLKPVYIESGEHLDDEYDYYDDEDGFGW